MVSDEELLSDLRRVSFKLNKTPSVREYEKHGEYSSNSLKYHFNSYNEAIEKVGGEPRASNLTDRELLNELRRNVDGDQAFPTPELQEVIAYAEKTYRERFGSLWRGIVQSGVRPYSASPLTKTEYESFLSVALSHSQPIESLAGLILGFTGIPCDILTTFNINWVSRLNDTKRDTLITVPAKQLPTNDRWVVKVPETWTDPTTDNPEPTGFGPLLKWYRDNVTESVPYNHDQPLRTVFRRIESGSDSGIIGEIAQEAGIERQVVRQDLRASIATHLARRGVPKWQIKVQVGAEETGWQRSVGDYLLWLHQFERTVHPDYDPPDIVLDPVDPDSPTE